jgi:hypothetical protein
LGVVGLFASTASADTYGMSYLPPSHAYPPTQWSGSQWSGKQYGGSQWSGKQYGSSQWSGKQFSGKQSFTPSQYSGGKGKKGRYSQYGY